MPRRCSVCDHPDRIAIETSLLNGASLRNIAERFGTSVTALHRHKEGHISARLASAKAAEGATGDASLLDRLRALNAEVADLLSKAKSAKDYDLALRAIARAENQLALEVKLISEQSSIDFAVHELLQLRMTDALIRLRNRFGDNPELLSQLYTTFVGDEPAGHAARKSLSN